MSKIQTTLEYLSSKVEGYKTAGSWHVGRCPSHDDQAPSLIWIIKADGNLHLNCEAGCDQNNVLAALGLTWKDLKTEESLAAGKPERTFRRFNPEKDQEYYNPVKSVDPQGKEVWHDEYVGPIKACYVYRDEAGNPVHCAIRIETPKGKKFVQAHWTGEKWKRGLTGVETVPYRLPEILAAIDNAETIYIAEGEKDCDSLCERGYAATCNAGGAGKWSDRLTGFIKGADHVVILPDQDAPGYEHANRVAKSLQAAHVVLVDRFDVPEGKDYSDWLAKGGDGKIKGESWTEKAPPKGALTIVRPEQVKAKPTQEQPEPTRILAGIDKHTPIKVLQEKLRQIAQLSPLEQDALVREIEALTGYSLSALKRQLKVSKADLAESRKNEQRQALDTATGQAVQAIADALVCPLNENGEPKWLQTQAIIGTPSGRYVVGFWGANKTASSYVMAEVRRLFDDGTDDFHQTHITAVSAVRHRVEAGVLHGELGKPVRVCFGPYMDRATNVFHTQTNIDEGVLILSGSDTEGSSVVDESPEHAENQPAFDAWKRLFGDNADDFVAHLIASITNLHPTNKHLLALLGSPESGKTKTAVRLAQMVDRTPAVLVASGLQGQWPRFFSSRMPILDNLDNSFNDGEVLDTLAASITVDTITVPQRYTTTGLTSQAGYPIFTSKETDLLNTYKALKSRSIQVFLNADAEIASISDDEANRLAREAKPHLWWLVQKYLDDIRAGLVPEAPGGIRQQSFARARWWVATQAGMDAAEAESLCAGYRATEEAETQSQFAQCFIRAFEVCGGRGGIPPQLKAADIWRIMEEHGGQEVNSIKYGKGLLVDAPQKGSAIRRFIDNTRVGSMIGPIKIEDVNDKHSKTRTYKIAVVAVADDITTADGNPGQKQNAVVAVVAGAELDNRGVEINNSSEPDLWEHEKNNFSLTPKRENTTATTANLETQTHKGKAPAVVKNGTTATTAKYHEVSMDEALRLVKGTRYSSEAVALDIVRSYRANHYARWTESEMLAWVRANVRVVD